MESVFLWRGVLIGLAVAAPVGPMAVLCMQRTLARGWRHGMVSGAGIASADAVYGAIAAFGLTIITSFLVGQQFWIRLLGCLFLGYLGIKTLLSSPASQSASEKAGSSAVGAYITTLLLTLTNPTTILSFIAIFAGAGLGTGGSTWEAPLLLVSGVFLGSLGWWLFICSLVSLLRSRIQEKFLFWINRLSGLVLLGFALYMGTGLFF